LQQHVCTRDQGGDRPLDDLVGADDHLADLAAQPLEVGPELVELPLHLVGVGHAGELLAARRSPARRDPSSRRPAAPRPISDKMSLTKLPRPPAVVKSNPQRIFRGQVAALRRGGGGYSPPLPPPHPAAKFPAPGMSEDRE